MSIRYFDNQTMLSVFAFIDGFTVHESCDLKRNYLKTELMRRNVSVFTCGFKNSDLYFPSEFRLKSDFRISS